jgi:hypothetical protein
MLKRYFAATTLMALIFCGLSWAQIDKIAIFNESVGWTSVEAAAAATDIIINNVTAAADISIYSDADMGTFAEANTNDGNFDVMIIFGYFPVSLYTPGNAQADDSLGELFLEGGDMILNTADYIFYVTEGGGANADTGLKNMTDSNFDLWTDGNTSQPTADGAAYTPSLIEFTAPRSFVVQQVEDDPDWEMEVIFGSSADGANADPAIIRNLTYGGRVGIVFQVSDDSMPRGDVMTEMINNYLADNVAAVKHDGKLPLTWAEVKSF